MLWDRIGNLGPVGAAETCFAASLDHSACGTLNAPCCDHLLQRCATTFQPLDVPCFGSETALCNPGTVGCYRRAFKLFRSPPATQYGAGTSPISMRFRLVCACVFFSQWSAAKELLHLSDHHQRPAGGGDGRRCACFVARRRRRHPNHHAAIPA